MRPRPCLRPLTTSPPAKNARLPKKSFAALFRLIRGRLPTKRSVPRPTLSGKQSTRKMARPQRGEVWLIDFGQAGKTRPALVVSVAFGDQDRALITVVPHTTSLRGSPFEITTRAPFLKPGPSWFRASRPFLPCARCTAWGCCQSKVSTESFRDYCVGLGTSE